MIFHVKRMRVKGRPIEPQNLRRAPEIRGDVSIRHEGCTLGRSAIVATLKGTMPMEAPQIPELIDATMHSMVPNAFVLSGIEIIEGTAYAQSWLCSRD